MFSNPSCRRSERCRQRHAWCQSSQRSAPALVVFAMVISSVFVNRGLQTTTAYISCSTSQGRRCILNSAGAAAASELLAGQPKAAFASSLKTPWFDIPMDFVDPPAPPDVAKPPDDAEKLPSGLVSKIILRPACALSKSTPPEQLAKCQKAKPYDKVVVDYTGWQPNGRMFDSSRVEKRTVRVNSVMPGWTEVLQLMSPGESRRVWIPADLAYGDAPNGTKPGGPLTFDIALFTITPQPKPPDTLGAPPGDASFTSTGLAYKVVASGSSPKSPGLESDVTVTYSGWAADGDMFMSTTAGAPSTFKVKDIPLPGLAEGVQLMKEGETRQFWIPPKLAFGEKPNSNLPSGTVVFEVQLSSVK